MQAYIPITKTPILLNFLQNLIALDKTLPFTEEIINDLYITGRCTCNDSECATVDFKRELSWDGEVPTEYFANTTKGLIIFHLLQNGYMEMEAIMYDKYPYRNEIIRAFNSDFSKPSKKETLQLKKYFENVALEELPTVIVNYQSP